MEGFGVCTPLNKTRRSTIAGKFFVVNLFSENKKASFKHLCGAH